jgi:Uma2 family endonuclease
MQTEIITDISQLDLNKRYTVSDYLTWQFDEMVELIKGKIFKMSPAPRSEHQAISSNIHFVLRTILKSKNCKVFHSPFDVYLRNNENDTVVQPDICIICDKSKITERGCIGSPDMIVEILSPATMKKDFDEKFHLYEENDVKEYWIVDPAYKQIWIYLLDEQQKYIQEGRYELNQDIPVYTLDKALIKTNDIFEF